MRKFLELLLLKRGNAGLNFPYPGQGEKKKLLHEGAKAGHTAVEKSLLSHDDIVFESRVFLGPDSTIIRGRIWA